MLWPAVATTVGLTDVATWQGFNAAQRRVFAAMFWQKQPLVVRGLLSIEELRDFCPLTPEDLLDLSCEPDAASRLVRETGGVSPWEVAHGPLDADGLSELAGVPGGSLADGAGAGSGSLWTVLVNQVDRALPEVEALRDFVADFVPRWRVDDVMVSYAKTGCSIGAHIDNYDVFLLQGRGSRTWSFELDRRSSADEAVVGGLPVRVLTRFAPGASVVLQPGDALYLPPRLAHHGVSRSDDCITYSIGFRAPTRPELWRAFGERLAERASEDAPFAPAGGADDATRAPGADSTAMPTPDGPGAWGFASPAGGQSNPAGAELSTWMPAVLSDQGVAGAARDPSPGVRRGRIDRAAVEHARGLLQSAVAAFLADEEAVTDWVGRALTAPHRGSSMSVTPRWDGAGADLGWGCAAVGGAGTPSAPSLAEEIVSGQAGPVWLRHAEGAVLAYADFGAWAISADASEPDGFADGAPPGPASPCTRRLFLDGAAIPVTPDAMPYLPLLCDSRVISAAEMYEPLRASAGLRTLLDELLRRDALYVDMDVGGLE